MNQFLFFNEIVRSLKNLTHEWSENICDWIEILKFRKDPFLFFNHNHLAPKIFLTILQKERRSFCQANNFGS